MITSVLLITFSILWFSGACKVFLWGASEAARFAWVPEAETGKFYLLPFCLNQPPPHSAVRILVFNFFIPPLHSAAPLQPPATGCFARPSQFFTARAVYFRVSPGLLPAVVYSAFVVSLIDLSGIWPACLCLKSVKDPWLQIFKGQASQGDLCRAQRPVFGLMLLQCLSWTS